VPFTGGAAPSPERYGAGEGNSNVPLVQRVYESVAAARGSAYDQTWPPATAVGAENIAFARALALDGYGGNQRLANNFQPGRMTSIGGLLSRWEKIFDVPPLPGDNDVVRNARVQAAWAKLGLSNATQPVVDAISAALGPVYGGVTYFTPSNDAAIWPGLAGSSALILNATETLADVGGLVGIPSGAAGGWIELGNAANAGNNGCFPIHGWVDSVEVVCLIPSPTAPDYGVGGTIGSPTITWTIGNHFQPAAGTVAARVYGWTSYINQINILALLPSGYYSTVGGFRVPNAKWYAALSACNSFLDSVLPAWMTWCVYLLNSTSATGFLLDEPNLDFEILNS
jgi:hypothetical protein